jgi:hypothetical protein
VALFAARRHAGVERNPFDEPRDQFTGTRVRPLGPVPLLDMGRVVLVARPRARDGDLVIDGVRGQVVCEFGAVRSESILRIRKRNWLRTPLSVSKTQVIALFFTDRLIVEPAMSVTMRVRQSSPLELPFPWPTRSMSTNPGGAFVLRGPR